MIEISGPFGFPRGNNQVRFGDRPGYNRQGNQGGNWQRRGGDRQ